MKGPLIEHERNLNKYRQVMEIKERAMKNLEKEFYMFQMEHLKYSKAFRKFCKSVKKGEKDEFTYDDEYLRKFDDREFQPSFLKSNKGE